MIKLDSILFEFLTYNYFACTLALAFLKGLAKITKSTTDDKVVTLIQNAFSSIKTRKGEKQNATLD